VFSVEPGIYVPGRFGVRFENLVHLGSEGPELLNAAAREPTLAG
jgi:Xaa-Pro aminopeptidase